LKPSSFPPPKPLLPSELALPTLRRSSSIVGNLPIRLLEEAE
jgi:hypothetical protein